MSVVIAFEDAGPCRKQLTIEVPAPAVEAELGRVVREWAKQVKIQGFRQGKAPASMIRTRFKTEIEQEVTERLVPRYWRQAEAEKSLDPLLQPKITEISMEKGEAMTFKAEVETRPHIDLNLEPAIELPEADATPTEVEIDDAIDEARRHHANWHEVERAAAVGDRVTGTIRTIVPNEAAEGDDATEGDEEMPAESPAAKPLDVELGGEGVAEELNLALTGKTAGQRGSFTRKTEGLEPEEIEYQFEIEQVRERELPEVDDDLAKTIGDFDSVEALREAVTTALAERKGEHVRNQRQQALLTELRSRHALELPRQVVDKEVEKMLHEQMNRMAQQGYDLESVSIDWAAIGEQMRPNAEQKVHNDLVLDAIAKEQDIQVDEEAFERLLGAYAAQQGRSTLSLRQELAEDGRLAQVRGGLRREQVVRVLLGEVDAETETTDDESNPER